MQKIPTLFRRDPDDMRKVLPEITPGCEWVLSGEGTPTRKYDGTCCMFDGEKWWGRREVKPGKQAPASFIEVEHDGATGKTVGWEPIEQSGFAKWHAEVIGGMDEFVDDSDAGTYELCGPKINGNPESFHGHILLRHSEADNLTDLVRTPADRPQQAYEELAAKLREMNYEGIVWHHPDGRMAKLKRRDF